MMKLVAEVGGQSDNGPPFDGLQRVAQTIPG
jgi:hypothetical protein